MTPNPVCYNGVNLPNEAVHLGKVSLGITPKDYRADAAQNWRAGISPNGALVLYSNTFDLGLTDQDSAEPRIWWTAPAATVADFKLKINEMLSRLPERAVNNYQVFPSYDDAMDWLHDTEGKYAIINSDYPEYYIPGEYCIFNIETGLHASYPASGLHLHTLANPNLTVGNALNSAALSWHGFTITNAAGDLNIGAIGQETGLLYDPTGHVISIDSLPRTNYVNNNLVFEAVIDINYSNYSCVFNLIDSSTNADVLRVDWDPATEQFIAFYSGLGSIIRFDPVTSPWTGDIHLIISVPATNDPGGLTNSVVYVNGTAYGVTGVTGSNFEWSNTTFFQIGNNRSLNRPIRTLKSAKAYVVPFAIAAEIAAELKVVNSVIVSTLY